MVRAVKNDYEALNAQLLDELPKLCSTILSLLENSVVAFIGAQRDFMESALKEHCMLLEV